MHHILWNTDIFIKYMFYSVIYKGERSKSESSLLISALPFIELLACENYLASLCFNFLILKWRQGNLNQGYYEE